MSLSQLINICYAASLGVQGIHACQLTHVAGLAKSLLGMKCICTVGFDEAYAQFQNGHRCK